MRTKLVSTVVASMLLVSSVSAAEKFIGVGYANVDNEGSSSSGVSLDVGVKFGETFKQKIAMKYTLLGKDVNNLGDIYYSLGYEVLPSTVLALNAGLGFESIGSIGTGSSKTAAYAIGLCYGTSLTYEISKSFDISASYSKYDLSFETLHHKVDVMDISLSYSF